MRRVQQGFTLIELVVVIVILGILAATALPKFVDLGKDARASVMSATEGAMRSANAMIYAKAATASKLSGVSTLTSTELPMLPAATSVNITNGFATAPADLILVMDVDSTKIKNDTNGLYYSGYAYNTCGVQYTKSAGAGQPPTYTTTTGSC